MLEQHGVSRLLASFNDVIPGYVFTGLLVSDDCLEKHPEEIKAFLRGFVKSIKFIEEKEEEARTFIPKYTSVELDIAMKSALRKIPENGEEDMKVLNYQKELMIEYGFLNEDLSLENIIDYSYLPDSAWIQSLKLK